MQNGNNGWKRQGNQAKDKGSSKRRKARVYLLQGGLVLILTTVLWRVYDVQKIYGKQLEKDSSNAIDVNHTVLAARGSILDAQGNQLAYDVPAFYLDVKTSALRTYADQIASEIAPALGTTTSTVSSFLIGKYKWKRWSYPVLSPAQTKLDAIFKKHDWAPNDTKSQWGNDLTFSPTEKRFYPFGQFAANVLGFVGTNGLSDGGIEQQYNSVLNGTNGSMTYQQDAEGFPIPGSVQVTKKASPGTSVQLTIDENIQGFVETVMDQLDKQYQPEHAAIIVTNPQTGAVLAMASRPTFDPNTYWAANPGALNMNWAVSSAFEPGSTFKPVVFASALAAHAITPLQTYKSGHIVVDGQTINDWNYGIGWGTLTYEGAMEKSSNVGFTKIALALGWPNLIHYMTDFGFLNRTGIDLPDEAVSDIFAPQNRGQLELATSGFGQGISVTPLQQVMAIGAIANGGKLMKPYVVKKEIDPNGKVVKQIQPTVVRQGFLPQSVISEVNRVMVLDTTTGIGIDNGAAIPGYKVAGKTGTAQIVDPKTHKYYSNRFETSFIGYAPANDPKVEVYVTLYWPKTSAGNQWGSTVAVPPARQILKDCLEYYHIAPTGDVQSASQTPATTDKASYVKTPNVVGMSEQNAQKALQKLGLGSMFAGQSGPVTKQWPEAGIEVPTGSKMYGLLSQASVGGKIVVPNLTGLSLRDATNLLAAMSLNVAPTGSGYVVSQGTPVGTKVASGATVSVVLKPKS